MISIPIISDFNDKGIKSAIREFKQLETAGQKAQFAIKKAAIPAAAALGAVTAIIGDSVKAAIEDEAAQASLARQIKASTGATDAQVKSVEAYITSLGKSAAISDDEARPAFQKLIVATKDVTKATELMNLATDVAAATGKPLVDVTDALAKAYAGNMKGLNNLSPEIKAMIKDGATLAETDGPQFNYAEINPNNHRSGFAVLNFFNGQLLWPELVHKFDEDQIQFRGEVIDVGAF